MAHSGLSKLLHESGKNLSSQDRKAPDPSKWPIEWKTVYYKEYDRFEAASLLQFSHSKSELTNLLANRRSNRDFKKEGLSLKDLSILLKYSCGEFVHSFPEGQEKHRAYPSAGGRYPIETYVVLRKSKEVETIKPGVYHYNVKKNCLEFLWVEKETLEKPELFFAESWPAKASAVIVLTSVFWRSENKYRDRGYRMQCIEVGCIIQNLYLLCDLLGLPHVSYSGTNDDVIEQLLRLNTDKESLIMSYLVG